MSSSIFSLPKLLLAGAALFAAGSAVWTVARAPLLVQLAEVDRNQVRQQLRASEDAIARLQVSYAHGDELTQTLLQREAQIKQLSREKHDAIAEATTGRPCLGGPALRLLNGAPGLSVAGMPAPTGSAAAAGATAATDTDAQGLVATDTDIAGWSVDAGAQYAVCRERLDALIDWHLPVPRYEH